MRNFSIFFVLIFALSASAQIDAPSRSIVDPSLAPFYHGVASGDPLSDRVLLWTRVTTTNATETVEWQIADDPSFGTIVNSGSTTTDASKDFTVKVDATGLQPNHWYYYRFKALGVYSLIGRTRTVPVGDNDNLRFAIVSCSNYQAGFFNAYNHIAHRNDIDAVIHLGDYIYEYEEGGYGYFNDTSRKHEPANEIMTLADYRIRHSEYKLDPDLRAVHQQYPFITVWDDHEFANDAYKDGAQNHTDTVEGLWQDRKNYGRQAYFEWVPIREHNDTIHREIKWGDLADIIMLDTRIEDRDKQVAVGSANVNDTTRYLIGPTQMDWFKNKLTTTTSRWKIVGNQVMMAPLMYSGNPFNMDQWDGYPAERNRLYNFLTANTVKNFVVLTGDIHTSWGNDLPFTGYNPSTGAGSVGVEFVCTSVTSPGLSGVTNSFIPIIKSQNTHMKYIDVEKKGYLLLDINKQKTQGDWVHFSTVTSKSYTTSIGGSWFANNNESFLTQATAESPTRPNAAPFAPNLGVGIKDIKNNAVIVGLYPNPVENEMKLQYYVFQNSTAEIIITDLKGAMISQQKVQPTEKGLYETEINTATLPSGNYTLTVKQAGKSSSLRFVRK